MAAETNEPAKDSMLASPASIAGPGRELTGLLYAGQVDELYGRFHANVVEAMPKSALEQLAGVLRTQLLPEVEIVEEREVPTFNVTTYSRVVKFKGAPEPLEVQWTTDREGLVQGLFVQARRVEAPSPHLEYEVKTSFDLPFAVPTYVIWGGRSVLENYHAATPDQRFALDLLLVGDDGTSHRGDGRSNEDYFCWGTPVFAPASGAIIEAVDGVADNVPGTMNPKAVAGNHVIIDHGNGEYSVLAHLQQGSLAVQKGDRVEGGAQLGLCGNSGNSSEPHLHFHVQDAPDFGRGNGIPIAFESLVKDGEVLEAVEIKKGWVVRRAPR